uniref:Bromo domain-containing protein n=1 Tax=Parascaris equorum TaxID=6256 RepID=A0A914R5H1_PAREQ
MATFVWSVPDYYTIIKNPMDMQTIKKKISENKYELRRQFLADIKQMLDNSRVYNGDNHVITETARKVLFVNSGVKRSTEKKKIGVIISKLVASGMTVFEVASVRLMEREPKLISLEKAINPLLDDNDIIGFSFILNEIIQECKNLPKSVAFHTKVDAKKESGDEHTWEKKAHRFTSGVKVDVQYVWLPLAVQNSILNGIFRSFVLLAPVLIIRLSDYSTAPHKLICRLSLHKYFTYRFPTGHRLYCRSSSFSACDLHVFLKVSKIVLMGGWDERKYVRLAIFEIESVAYCREVTTCKLLIGIKVNSELYNGPPETSQYTTKAIEICELAERMLEVSFCSSSFLQSAMRFSSV